MLYSESYGQIMRFFISFFLLIMSEKCPLEDRNIPNSTRGLNPKVSVVQVVYFPHRGNSFSQFGVQYSSINIKLQSRRDKALCEVDSPTRRYDHRREYWPQLSISFFLKISPWWWCDVCCNKVYKQFPVLQQLVFVLCLWDVEVEEVIVVPYAAVGYQLVLVDRERELVIKQCEKVQGAPQRRAILNLEELNTQRQMLILMGVHRRLHFSLVIREGSGFTKRSTRCIWRHTGFDMAGVTSAKLHLTSAWRQQGGEEIDLLKTCAPSPAGVTQVNDSFFS